MVSEDKRPSGMPQGYEFEQMLRCKDPALRDKMARHLFEQSRRAHGTWVEPATKASRADFESWDLRQESRRIEYEQRRLNNEKEWCRVQEGAAKGLMVFFLLLLAGMWILLLVAWLWK